MGDAAAFGEAQELLRRGPPLGTKELKRLDELLDRVAPAEFAKLTTDHRHAQVLRELVQYENRQSHMVLFAAAAIIIVTVMAGILLLQ